MERHCAPLRLGKRLTSDTEVLVRMWRAVHTGEGVNRSSRYRAGTHSRAQHGPVSVASRTDGWFVMRDET